MILLILTSVITVLVFGCFILNLTYKSSGKKITDVSDANYMLKQDIEISRKRAMQLNQSLQELKESMDLLQMEKDSLLNKQYDLLYYQKENLKKWSDEVKN